MQKRFLHIFILYFLPFISQAQNTWIPRDSVGGQPRSSATGFSINGLGYAGLGFDHVEYKRSLYRYDPVSDDWDKMESMGGDTGDGNERSAAVSFVIGSFAYIGLGQGANPYFKDFWKYDPATDSWTQVADYGGTGRTQACAFTIGNFGYAGTGMGSSGFKKDFWKYDPSGNSWTQVADFGGTARRLAVGVAMGGQGYVGTGDDGVFKNDFWQYDAATDTWIQKASFPGTPRYGATGFAIFPQVFIGTGYDNTLVYTDDFWQYNYWNNTWTQIADFSGGARSNAFAFTIGTRGYVGCGYDGSLKDDFYEYFPVLSSVENEFEKMNVQLFPNPASDYVRLSFEENIRVDEIVIYSMNGSIIRSINFSEYSVNTVTLPCNDLPTGNYYCAVISNETIFAAKLFTIVR
jgi:N-acetylneuraminic acid mutarotase